LLNMSEEERTKLHRKGIFTVTQLSHTFRSNGTSWMQTCPNISPAFPMQSVSTPLDRSRVY
jgi:hypothetical protein